MSDYYEILEIQKTATKDEIKQSYKRLAKIHHPDKGGDKEIFQNIQVAYETLSDDIKRQEYDNPGPNINDIFGGGMHFGPGGIPFGNGNMPFDFLFRNNGKKRNNDQYYTIKITLNDVYNGLKKTLNIKNEIKCNNCNKQCSLCRGTGIQTKMMNMGFMQIVQEQPCLNCNSYGIIKDSKNCDLCGNKGVILKENILNIVIPKGVENDKNFIFEGLGEQSKNENELPGNLVVIIKIEDSKLFKREDLNLVYNIDISFKDSVIGKKLNIPHFKNQFTISTRAFGIIDPNKRYPLYNKGLRDENDNHGNMYLKFNIDYQTQLNDEQIKKLEEIL
jgi:DnaJ family protein A protein 2